MDIKEKQVSSNLIIKESIVPKEVETSGNCITGDTDYLLPKLKQAFKKAKAVDIIVAFLMESGVKIIADDLRQVVIEIYYKNIYRKLFKYNSTSSFIYA